MSVAPPDSAHTRYRTPVSVIGWSLGGIYTLIHPHIRREPGYR
jgi:hypothetical protein